MRASTAFFVGIGTVCLAITGGLAGGLVIGNIMSPPPAKHAAEAARAKQPTQPVPAASALPYTGSTLAFSDPSMKPKAAPTEQKDQKADSGTPASPPPVPAATKAAASSDETSKPADHPRQPTQEAQQAEPTKQQAAAKQEPAPAKQEPAPAKQANAPEDANAKARNSDLKHAEDRRRAGRAQRWAARHNYGQGQDRNQDRNQDQNQDQVNDQAKDQAQHQNGNANSEQQARDDRNSDRGRSSATYSYNYPDRRYRDDSRGRYRDAERDDDDRGPRYYVDEGPRVGEGPRFGFPRIQLFGPDD